MAPRSTRHMIMTDSDDVTEHLCERGEFPDCPSLGAAECAVDCSCYQHMYMHMHMGMHMHMHMGIEICRCLYHCQCMPTRATAIVS